MQVLLETATSMARILEVRPEELAWMVKAGLICKPMRFGKHQFWLTPAIDSFVDHLHIPDQIIRYSPGKHPLISLEALGDELVNGNLTVIPIVIDILDFLAQYQPAELGGSEKVKDRLERWDERLAQHYRRFLKMEVRV